MAVFSQKQLMDRAFRLANSAGVEPHQSAIIDNAFTAEDYFPIALREAVKQSAGIPNEANSVKRTYPLTLVAGEATLPDTVLTECLDSSSLFSSSDATVAKLSSYEPRYSDYLDSGAYNQLAYYTVRGAVFCYRAPGELPGVSTATLSLVCVGIPDIPAALATAMVISSETAERCIEILSKMLRGQQ